MGSCCRRDFLKIGTGFLATWLVPATGMAAVARQHPRRVLSFYNVHTGERLVVCYHKNGVYSRSAMRQINHILRDHRTGDVQAIDPTLLDMLHTVRRRLGSDSPVHIISGYRSPQTNARLRKQSKGVATFSYHMLGRAIDIRLPGCHTPTLHQACLDMKIGGVGYYPQSDFVHLDTGAFRTWKG